MLIQELYRIYLQSSGVSTDSRSIEDGQLFFALSGPNFNGNKFASTALSKGAAKAIVDDSQFKAGEDYLLVNDALHTLQELSKYHRAKMMFPIIGITGSNGKTTTKELIAAVLGQKFKTQYTQGNLNNHIGVPLSLLSIPLDTELAIIEMGANHIGEIAGLCQLAKPTHGLITNISGAHLEGFGSIEGVKKAKSELYEYLDSIHGIAFVNRGDQVLMEVLPESLNRIYYDYQSTGDSIFELLRSFPYLQIKYRTNSKEQIINSNLYGDYNYMNIIAAISIGEYFKVASEAIIRGIEQYQALNNRSEYIKWEKKELILDAYNANPASMRAGIKHFADSFQNDKILVLGEMAELGQYSLKEHQDLLTFIEQWSWKDVFLVGEVFTDISPKRYKSFTDIGAFCEFLTTHDLPDHSAIFIKGSRSVKLEKALDFIKQ